MSYVNQQGLGGFAGDTLAAVKAAASAVDPYFPEALCRVDQIRALRKNRKFLHAVFGKGPTVPVPSCALTPDNLPGGIGVEQAMRPMRSAVYIYEHPTLVALAAVAFFAIPFFAGVAVGKRIK